MMQFEKVSLRRALGNDITVLEHFFNQNHRELHLGQIDPFLIKQWISDQSSDSIIFIIDLNGMAIGYLFVNRGNDPLSIYEYFLLPEQRGKGYGFDAIAKLMETTCSLSIDVFPNAWRSAAGAM